MTPPLGAILGRSQPGKSLFLIFPVFLLYSVGVVFAPAQSGVDFVSRNVLTLLGTRRERYLLVYVGLAVVYGLAVLWLDRRRPRSTSLRFLPLLLECSLYALSMAAVMVLVMRQRAPVLLSVNDVAMSSGATQVILSLGAGVYEELVFRLGAFSLVAAILRLLSVPHMVAVAGGMLGSSLIFAVAHHWGQHGDPLLMGLVVSRFLAGMIFATLFYFRSLAHAAYTHVLYDLFVLAV